MEVLKLDQQQGKFRWLVVHRQNLCPSARVLDLRRYHHRLQVVGERNNRQQDQDKHAQRDTLNAQTRQPARRVAFAASLQPQEQQRHGEGHPRQIEKDFHAASVILPEAVPACCKSTGK